MHSCDDDRTCHFYSHDDAACCDPSLTILLTPAQDFRTGYYTLASPKALFTVQICGAFLGVCFSPAVFTFYNHAFKSAPYTLCHCP